jgi:hypothetical protein
MVPDYRRLYGTTSNPVVDKDANVYEVVDTIFGSVLRACAGTRYPGANAMSALGQVLDTVKIMDDIAQTTHEKTYWQQYNGGAYGNKRKKRK